MDLKIFILILVVCFLPYSNQSPYRGRSKTRNSEPTYDQKQTGDYNIQLHLKDFEIVALLSDSAFGDLGDYEYNYDYSDITVKPGLLQSTTKKHPTTSRPAYPAPIATTKAPNSELKPTETSKSEDENIVTPGVNSEVNAIKELPEKTSNVSPIENLTILDNKEDLNQEEENIPIVVHRKCASGFTRNKMGRCRRVRKPQAPFSFGISRLATLASKLRQTNESLSSGDSSSGDP